jgi:hypothetical protein
VSFTIDVEIFENPRDRRLRRHVMHDSRSLAYESAPRDAPLPTRASLHRSHGQVWDQQIGCCTMCAAAGMMITDPFHVPYRRFTLRQIERLYSEETRMDNAWLPGEWPPDDTGSSGLWSMKLLQRKGLISGYQHMFSLNAVLATLVERPVSVGTWWYESMEYPAADHLIEVSPGSACVGGHQYLLVGQDPGRRRVRVRNSWGRGYGDDGYVDMSWDTLARLLAEDGDAITAVALT